MELYHRCLPELPQARTWGKPRQALSGSRWRETRERLRRKGLPHSDDDVLAWFEKFFERVRGSPFLMGKVNGRNENPFFANLEWLLKPSNYAKVIDGNYLPKGTNA